MAATLILGNPKRAFIEVDSLIFCIFFPCVITKIQKEVGRPLIWPLWQQITCAIWFHFRSAGAAFILIHSLLLVGGFFLGLWFSFRFNYSSRFGSRSIYIKFIISVGSASCCCSCRCRCAFGFLAFDSKSCCVAGSPRSARMCGENRRLGVSISWH